MNIKHFFRSFSKEHKVMGTEMYLQGDLNMEMETLQDNGEFYYCVSGEFTNNEAYYAWERKGECQILIHEKDDILHRTACSCNAFEKNHYSCSHVAGLMAGYLLKTEGRECFADTEFETLMQKKTKVDTPFAKGILRKTDVEIQSVLKSVTQYELPVWGKSSLQTEMLGISCIVNRVSGGITIELKAGGKKKYVIKDLREFLRRYRIHAIYSFGKNPQLIAPDTFEDGARKILDYMMALSEVSNESHATTGLFRGYSGQNNRQMFLSSRNLDGMLDLIGEYGFLIAGSGNKEYHIDNEKNGISVNIEKKQYGMKLFIDEYRILGKGVEKLYLYDDQGCFSVPRGDQGKLADILVAVEGKRELYIGEDDVRDFCLNVLPSLQKYCHVKMSKLEPAVYQAEMPRFEIRLDAPQKNMISCQPKVIYEKQTQSCLLFNQNTPDVVRNAAAETQIANRISHLFSAYEEETGTLYVECDDGEMYQFLTHAVPQLKQMGEVYISDSIRRMKVRSLPNPEIGIQVEQGGLTVSLSTSTMSNQEMIEVLSAYQRKKTFHRLKDGSFISFQSENAKEWDTLAELYQSYGMKNPEKMKLPLYRAMYLDEQLKTRDKDYITTNNAYESLVEKMSMDSDEDYMPDDTLKNVLRQYQKDGFQWLCKLKDCGFGGVLADDMGLGKTLQVLTFLQRQKKLTKTKEDMRTLIIVPASLVFNWAKEIAAFTPDLSYKVITGTVAERKELLEQYKQWDADIWITSYDLLKRDIEYYEDITFANEVIDEAQNIKNHNTQASQAVRLIKSSFRLALTGTPIENKLSELWSIFDYLMPGFLYGYTRFRAMYEMPIVSQGDEVALEHLRGLVHPFILRRLKRDVLKDLPDKIEKTIAVQLQGQQKKLYDAHAKRLMEYLDKQSPEEFMQSKLEVLAELTKLRQLCCAPELIFDQFTDDNAKLDTCIQLVEQAIEGEHKVLLFSQFTSMLDIICKCLQERGIAYYRIDGSVKKEKRIEMVDAFQEDEVPVFCISLKAGGTGLNLTAADIVIHYDPWWNVAAQNQATDRAHRIGQRQIVNVYKLIAEQTIEERIQKLQEQKAALADDLLLGDKIASIAIDKEALLELLL